MGSMAFLVIRTLFFGTEAYYDLSLCVNRDSTVAPEAGSWESRAPPGSFIGEGVAGWESIDFSWRFSEYRVPEKTDLM
jgi:hypothetical protein